MIFKYPKDRDGHQPHHDLFNGKPFFRLSQVNIEDCKGKLTNAWGLGGLFSAHSRLG